LDCAGVTLQGTLYIMHLFQGIAHVGIGIGESWLNSYCLFVVHECLVKFALLLQDRGQIRMRSGELWKHFQSFQIESGSLLNKALLTFDIRQIIERIRMIWTQP